MEGKNKIEGVKLNVPHFKGKSDLDTYLDWEMMIEHVFSYNDYIEEQKVKLVVAEFSDYALVWWNKNQRHMMREEGREINTDGLRWEGLCKRGMFQLAIAEPCDKNSRGCPREVWLWRSTTKRWKCTSEGKHWRGNWGHNDSFSEWPKS